MNSSVLRVKTNTTLLYLLSSNLPLSIKACTDVVLLQSKPSNMARYASPSMLPSCLLRWDFNCFFYISAVPEKLVLQYVHTDCPLLVDRITVFLLIGQQRCGVLFQEDRWDHAARQSEPDSCRTLDSDQNCWRHYSARHHVSVQVPRRSVSASNIQASNCGVNNRFLWSIHTQGDLTFGKDCCPGFEVTRCYKWPLTGFVHYRPTN